MNFTFNIGELLSLGAAVENRGKDARNMARAQSHGAVGRLVRARARGARRRRSGRARQGCSGASARSEEVAA